MAPLRPIYRYNGMSWYEMRWKYGRNHCFHFRSNKKKKFRSYKIGKWQASTTRPHIQSICLRNKIFKSDTKKFQVQNTYGPTGAICCIFLDRLAQSKPIENKIVETLGSRTRSEWKTKFVFVFTERVGQDDNSTYFRETKLCPGVKKAKIIPFFYAKLLHKIPEILLLPIRVTPKWWVDSSIQYVSRTGMNKSFSRLNNDSFENKYRLIVCVVSMWERVRYGRLLIGQFDLMNSMHMREFLMHISSSWSSSDW